MSTALYETAASIADRRLEIDTLIAAAEQADEGSSLHKALCRSTCVLLAAHLEGFLKDAIRSIVLDLNFNLGSFSEMPQAIQRTFCEKIAFYEGVPPNDINNRIKQLQLFFQKNSVPIEMDAFSYKENPNKNPNHTFIDNAFSKIGVPKIVGSLANSKLDVVFDNDARTNYTIIRELRRRRSSLYQFPYRDTAKLLSITIRPKTDGESIWHAFITTIMARRHSIVHGDTTENPTSTPELREDAVKLDTFMQGILYSAASHLALA